MHYRHYCHIVQMNKSTILMICNSSGYTNPANTAGWAIVDFDWYVGAPRACAI